MKIKLLRGMMINGEFYAAGKEIDLVGEDELEAKAMIASGRATPLVPAKATPQPVQAMQTAGKG